MEKMKIDFTLEEDRNLMKEMKENYLNCPSAIKYLNGLKVPEEVIDDNISLVNDLVEDINYCSKCPGLKNCSKKIQHFCTKLVYCNGILEREMTPCKEFCKRISFEKRFVVNDIEGDFVERSVTKIDKSKKRAAVVTKFLNYLNKDITNEWIYITGSIGTGRSYLASVLLCEIVRRKDIDVGFVNCSTRFRELADLYYKDKALFQNELDKLTTLPVLVLDDFGNEYKNDFVRDTIVSQIINLRATKKLYTIFTSDFSIDDVVGLYSLSKASEIKAKQIGKVLKAYCKEEISLGDLAIY